MDKIDLTDLEKDLKELIGARRGKTNAIPRAKLMELFDGLCERDVRRAIKHLVMEHGVPIASGHGGYFTPVTPEEIDQACRYYHGYAMACLTVESRLRGCSLPELVGQIEMEFNSRKGAKDAKEKIV
jgi:hypothetical protein